MGLKRVTLLLTEAFTQAVTVGWSGILSDAIESIAVLLGHLQAYCPISQQVEAPPSSLPGFRRRRLGM